MWRTNDSGRDKALARAEIPSGGFAEASNHFAATTRRPAIPPAKERAPLLKNPQAVKPKIGVKMRANVDTKRTKTSMRLARMVGARKQGRNRRAERSADKTLRQTKRAAQEIPDRPLDVSARPRRPRVQRSHRVWLRSRAERDLTFRRTAPQWTVIEKAFIRSLSRSALASSSAKSDSKVTDSPRRSAIMV